MKNTTSQIQEYLERFRRGDGESAFFGLTEMEHDVLPELIAAFKKERDSRVRAFLVEIIWQHRQQSVIPFLAEVLHDPEPDVWKEALDGKGRISFTASIRRPAFRENPSVSTSARYRGVSQLA